MAIVFKNNEYDITIDSKIIIGVMGGFYEEFLSLMEGDIFYLGKRVSISDREINSILDLNNKNITKLIKEFNLEEDFINKRINELSHSEQKILKYLLMVLSNKKIMIIDEPFMDLDSNNKKKVIILLKNMIKENKTIIIGSNDSNIIYSLCKKVLFINNKSHCYGDIDLFKDKNILKKYHVAMPNIVKFVELANEKGIKLNYSRDIRDLIKDVYRNVS